MYLVLRKKNGIYANISLFHSYSEVTVAIRSGPYPDQMVDQYLEMTSTALNISRDLGPYSWKILVQRVAPSKTILWKFLEMWQFPLKIKEKSNSESILTLKRGLKVQNC